MGIATKRHENAQRESTRRNVGERGFRQKNGGRKMGKRQRMREGGNMVAES
jgi:hypothetical protein